ncbi:hypothetical protein [Alloacidobacterium sp.]|uniref:hypothetical protein n=1 Tax=Alloacidobacterium sp. TaxID=2951999 RepID=UPI002D37B523|nr:hypothetical protein [Alloacidobacterium sp.]HYK37126.1 hypothetical protein [Alloacidobacterium sp.]
MALVSISNLLAYAEPFLWLAALLAFFRVRKHAALSAFGVFLGIRMVRAFLLLGMSHSQFVLGGGHSIYFYTKWITYLASCIALFFALQELFINMMAPLPGLKRLGVAIFRWAAAASLVLALSSVVTLASASSIHDHLSAVFTEIAVSFSVLALCLLAFLVVSVHALGLSYRNRVFGLCLGLGLLVAMSLMVNGLHFSTAGAWPGYVAQIVVAVALLTWIAFLAFPEPVQEQAAAAIRSSALLWNDLAQELGPSAPQQPIPQQSGFLQNVESVVDRVLAKNSLTG